MLDKDRKSPLPIPLRGCQLYINKSLSPTICILSNPRVKSPITNIIEDNKFEDLAYWFYILLIFNI